MYKKIENWTCDVNEFYFFLGSLTPEKCTFFSVLTPYISHSTCKWCVKMSIRLRCLLFLTSQASNIPKESSKTFSSNFKSGHGRFIGSKMKKNRGQRHFALFCPYTLYKADMPCETHKNSVLNRF